MTPPTITRQRRLLPWLVLLLAATQIIAPFKGWMVLLVGLGGAWLIGALWARALAGSLTLRREMRFGWAQVGDRLEERWTLANASSLPALWIELHDESSLPGYRPGRATGIGGAEQTQWITAGVCTRRGVYTLGPTTLRTGDPLGIYSVTLHDPAVATLMVTPPIVALPAIEIAPGGRSGEGRPRPHTLERSISAGSVRELAPGDSMRWIHWPTTARTTKPHVRLFEGMPVGDWWVVLDLNAAVQAGAEQHSTEEHGVILAASLADRGLRDGNAVGLVVNGAQLDWLPPRREEHQRLTILRTLALARQGGLPLGDLLERMRPQFGPRSSLVLITPDGGAWLPALLRLLRRGVTPTVLLLDGLTFGGEQSVAGSAAQLGQLGITHSIIGSELLATNEAQPGQQGAWDWRVLASGRVLPVHRPGDMSWRALR